MKVVQVISGYLPIEDTGKRRWGAVELIQSEYKKHLNKNGIDCEIKWLNDVNLSENPIVHIHVANLCIEAQKRGIPYIYSNHDHTSNYYGKGSDLYKEQLSAIKGSVFSITHAESVINFFPDTDKLFYLPHGVDTSFYVPSPEPVTNKKLLMIANNGAAGDYGNDRKGFRLGIEAAKRLNLPITIVGADANKRFFEIHSDLLEYPKLTVDYSNPTESEKLKYLQTHSIFLHPSACEFGSPNLTLLEAWACSLPMVAAYDGKRHIEGLFMLNKLDAGEICDKINYIYSNYENTRNSMISSNKNFHDWSSIVGMLTKMYSYFEAIRKETTTETAKKEYLNIYQ
jgi:glycosyltransferase involved in cell wall biosynthesis